jgi:hypothetical protein
MAALCQDVKTRNESPMLMDGEKPEKINQRLDAEIDHPCTPELIRKYFDLDGSFAGVAFDCLGHNPKDQFLTDDLFAVTRLDVGFKPLAGGHICGRDSERLG